MDLGLQGRKAIVCAASKGLGRACAFSLARNGVEVTIVARTPGPLEETAREIREAAGVADGVAGGVSGVVAGGVSGVVAGGEAVVPLVATVAADITTPAGRAAALAACPEPDILVNNAGGPPPGDFRDWSRDDWVKALDANMLTPIEMIKASLDGMIARGFGRVVNITSSAVKAPIATLGLSNGARAGLTGFVAGLARQSVRHGVTINNLLPGPFDTDRLRANTRSAAERAGRPFDELYAERAAANPAGRFGRPEEFGEACAFLCSAQAGYITGQNLLMDGGGFPGTL